MDDRLKELLYFIDNQQASDLHIIPGNFPIMRKDGELFPLTQFDVLTVEDAKVMLFSLLNEDGQKKLLKYKDLDFSFSLDEKRRFRCNVYLQIQGWAGAFRFIPNEIKGIEELNLPPILNEFIDKRQGFILITGPAGVGKSTTLASLIDTINNLSFLKEKFQYILLIGIEL
jgi:twitching motility protein PilT